MKISFNNILKNKIKPNCFNKTQLFKFSVQNAKQPYSKGFNLLKYFAIGGVIGAGAYFANKQYKKLFTDYSVNIKQETVLVPLKKEIKGKYIPNSAGIIPSDKLENAVLKLAQDDEETLEFFTEMFKRQTEAILKNLEPPVSNELFLCTFTSLDDLGIYGNDIYLLYKDVCGENFPIFVILVNFTQLGMIDKNDLYYAIENKGEGSNIDTIVHNLLEGRTI